MEEKTLKIGGGKPEAFLVCDKSLADCKAPFFNSIYRFSAGFYRPLFAKKVERFFQIFWIDVRRSLNYAVTSVCKPDERESQILRLNIIVRQAIRIRHDLRHIVAHHPAQKIDIMNTLIHQRAAVLLPCAAPFCLFIVVAVPVPSDMRRAVQHPAETAVLNRFSDFLYRLIKSVLMAGTNR